MRVLALFRRCFGIALLLTTLLLLGASGAQAGFGVPAQSAPDIGQPDAPASGQAVTDPQVDARVAARAKVDAAVENGLTLLRPGQIGVVTIWDGNKFTQCRQGPKDWITCEAAGVAMQPSLAHVLTPDRAMRLFALGWTVDPHFGSYLRLFPQSTRAKSIATQMIATLIEGYDADLLALEVRTAWLADVKCLPRNGPRQPLAGSIDDAPSMAKVAIHTCLFAPAISAATHMSSVGELIGLYGQRVRGEIARLKVNSGTEGLHLVLSSKLGYVQCAPDNAPPAIYCEAASADSMPQLAKVLTPDRIAELHRLGFADPGRAPNYARTTLLAQADPFALTQDLLTILFDVYGYRGDPVLVFSTERGH